MDPMETKKKALDGIKGFLDDRMVGRMKPKAVAVEVSEEKKPMDGEAGPGEEMPGHEGSESSLEEKVEQMGGDLSRLDPEEQAKLSDLYQKMGC